MMKNFVNRCRLISIQVTSRQQTLAKVQSSLRKSRTFATAPINHATSTSVTQRPPGMKSSVLTSEMITIDVEQQKNSISSLWLRDNCRCDECYNHTTRQRTFLAHEHHTSAVPQSVTQDGNNLNIIWADSHASVYDVKWIRDNTYPWGAQKNKQYDTKYLWDGDSIKEQSIKASPYHSLLNTKEGIADVVQNVWKYGFALVDGVPHSVEGTQQAAERLGIITQTLFGGMWSFTNDLKHKDTAYTSVYIGPHTDTTYFNSPCGIQIFHCLEHDGDGGATLLVDGFHAAEQLRAEDEDAFRLLADTRVRHEYREPGYSLCSVGTILQTDPTSDHLRMVRYNHYDRSPIDTIPQESIPAFYSSLSKLSQHLENPGNQQWIKLHPGTLMIIDNWRVLHGRDKFTGKRSMCGCYLNIDEWQSNIRTVVHNDC